MQSDGIPSTVVDLIIDIIHSEENTVTIKSMKMQEHHGCVGLFFSSGHSITYVTNKTAQHFAGSKMQCGNTCCTALKMETWVHFPLMLKPLLYWRRKQLLFTICTASADEDTNTKIGWSNTVVAINASCRLFKHTSQCFSKGRSLDLFHLYLTFQRNLYLYVYHLVYGL